MGAETGRPGLVPPARPPVGSTGGGGNLLDQWDGHPGALALSRRSSTELESAYPFIEVLRIEE
jgi:hypothetical protein